MVDIGSNSSGSSGTSDASSPSARPMAVGTMQGWWSSLAAPNVLCCPFNAALSDAIHTEAAMPTNERMKADAYVVPSNETVLMLPVILLEYLVRVKLKPPPAAVAAAVV